MDLDMTVDAATTDYARIAIRSDAPRGQIVTGEKRGRMVPGAELGVTFLTQEGRRRDEQTTAIRAVGKVAARAALCHGSVFPDKGSALIHMAIRTQFEGRAGAQESIRH